MTRAAEAVDETQEPAPDDEAPALKTKPLKKKKVKKKGQGAVNALAKPHPMTSITAASRAQKLAKQIGDKLRVHFITGRQGADSRIQYMSTGHQILDDAISASRDDDMEIVDGTGRGIPRGRMIEIFGAEAAAKSSLALCMVAAAQKRGELAAFIDVEHALNDTMAAKMFGVDMESLLWAQPDDGEDAISMMIELVQQKEVGIIVLDSVAALVSRAEKEGNKAMGQQARMMSEVCRKLTSLLTPGGPSIIFINQIRYKIGVMFGNPETTSGGKALPFYSSVRLNVRKKKDIKKTSKKQKGVPKIVGMHCSLKVIKNKVAPMGGAAAFVFDFRKGIRFGKLDGKDEDDL